ncbi:hypothetical protein [Kitasatospora sp. NPDC088779]|uniref:hypothetical protein n=1 Tax=unclassified Kitasatospora TaxID=2633591 RepID=UPI00343A85EE
MTAQYRPRRSDGVSPEVRRRVAELLEQGLDAVAAARRTGLSWQMVHELGRIDEAVHRAINGLGPEDPVELIDVPRRPQVPLHRQDKRFGDDRQEQVLAGLREGLTPHSAAVRAGVSPCTVKRHMEPGRPFAVLATAALAQAAARLV